jgi:hypothetical protein
MFPHQTPGYEIRKKIFFVNTGSMIFRCDSICPFSTYRGTCHQLFYFCDFRRDFFTGRQPSRLAGRKTDRQTDIQTDRQIGRQTGRYNTYVLYLLHNKKLQCSSGKYFSVCLPVCLPVCLSVCMSFCLPACLLACLPAYIFV